MRETWKQTVVRALVAGASVLIATSLAACGQGGPEPQSTPSETVGPTVSSSPGSVRDRLAAALADTSPAQARLVQNPQTKLTPVEATWLPGWQILDVSNMTPPHPQRFYAALATDGRAEVLSGRPEAFSEVLVDAGAAIDSAETAAGVAATFLDATRDFRTYAYRIDSVEDIKWLSKPNAGEEAARDQLMKTYRSKVRSPQSAESGDGWLVTVWMVQGRDLVTHKVSLASGTSVTDQAETVEKDIPVPFSA